MMLAIGMCSRPKTWMNKLYFTQLEEEVWGFGHKTGSLISHVYLTAKPTSQKDLVGTFTIRANGECGHIGYMVYEHQRSNGYGTSIARVAIKYCQEKLGLNKIDIWVNSKNLPSIAIIEKLGGQLLKNRKYYGELIHVYEVVLYDPGRVLCKV